MAVVKFDSGLKNISVATLATCYSITEELHHFENKECYVSL